MGTGYLGEYSLLAALVFEIVATFLFMVAIHLVGINVTGVSVNPARSIVPAGCSSLHRSLVQWPLDWTSKQLRLTLLNNG